MNSVRYINGYVVATDMLRDYNKANKRKKEISEFLSNSSTVALIDHIRSAYNIHHVCYTRRGRGGYTAMHPALMDVFQAWLNRCPNQTRKKKKRFKNIIKDIFAIFRGKNTPK